MEYIIASIILGVAFVVGLLILIEFVYGVVSRKLEREESQEIDRERRINEGLNRALDFHGDELGTLKERMDEEERKTDLNSQSLEETREMIRDLENRADMAEKELEALKYEVTKLKNNNTDV